jgi:hypothetical protein
MHSSLPLASRRYAPQNADMDLETVLGLETQVWEALVGGDADADARLLAEDFLGVYSTGFAGRAEHAAQLANGPTVSEYSLSDERLMMLSDDDALLCYRAEYRAPGASEAASMYVSSLWSRRSGEWLNVFSQDTPTA